MPLAADCPPSSAPVQPSSTSAPLASSTPTAPLTSSTSSDSPPPPAPSIPFSNIPLSSSEILQLLQESPTWVADLFKKSLFDGLDVQVLNQSELPGKVASLLAIAYETRDLHIAELFALERRHRRDALALELQKLTLLDARAKISRDYTELDDVKVVLTNKGFADEVRKYTQHCDAPIGCNIPPSDLAYVYDATEIRPPRFCAHPNNDSNGISVNRIAISV